MRLLLVTNVVACAANGPPPSNPADLIGSWANVPTIHYEALPPFNQEIGSSSLTITFGSDGSFEQTSVGSAAVLGTFIADAYSIEFTTDRGTTPTPYSATSDALMLSVQLTPSELIGTDGIMGSWVGSAGTLDLDGDHTVDGTLSLDRDAETSWSVLDGVHVVLETEPGNELINVDYEAMPWRALGGVLYTRM